MDRVLRARIFAAVALAAAAFLAWKTEWGASLGLFAMGAAALLLVTERDVPTNLPDRGAEGMMSALASLVSELHLSHGGVILPGRTPDAPSLVFLGAAPLATPPAEPAAGQVTFHRSMATATGCTIPAPGSGLEREWARLHGLPRGGGIEEATVHVQKAFKALGLGRNVRVASGGARVRIAYEPIAFADLCREAAGARAPWDRLAGCPACSFAGILASRAHGGPLRIVATGHGSVELEAVA